MENEGKVSKALKILFFESWPFSTTFSQWSAPWVFFCIEASWPVMTVYLLIKYAMISQFFSGRQALFLFLLVTAFSIKHVVANFRIDEYKKNKRLK